MSDLTQTAKTAPVRPPIPPEAPLATLKPPPFLEPLLARLGLRTVADVLYLGDGRTRRIGEGRGLVMTFREAVRLAIWSGRVLIDPDRPWEHVLGGLPAHVQAVLRAEGLSTLLDVRDAVKAGSLASRTGLSPKQQVLLHYTLALIGLLPAPGPDVPGAALRDTPGRRPEAARPEQRGAQDLLGPGGRRGPGGPGAARRRSPAGRPWCSSSARPGGR
jgi:hypothetical protein